MTEKSIGTGGSSGPPHGAATSATSSRAVRSAAVVPSARPWGKKSTRRRERTPLNEVSRSVRARTDARVMNGTVKGRVVVKRSRVSLLSAEPALKVYSVFGAKPVNVMHTCRHCATHCCRLGLVGNDVERRSEPQRCGTTSQGNLACSEK